jgi:hypothetical protein
MNVYSYVKVLGMIADAPWYVPNMVIRTDLQTPTVQKEIRPYSSQYSAPQHTPKRPSSETRGAIRQQTIAMTPATCHCIRFYTFAEGIGTDCK